MHYAGMHGGPVLSVQGVSKRYGRLEAVKGVDFEVASGEIFALIGPNGAGKTTILRIVGTILRASRGSVTVEGIDTSTHPEEVRERISYLPEEAGAYKSISGEAYLRFFARLYYANSADQQAAVARGREICGLGERLKDKAGSYSKGMTRKLLLARTLMCEPRLAILDEPTSGLDVLNAMEVRDTIKQHAAQGTAVLLSSHNMLEIEYLSDRVALLHEGRIRETGTPKELRERYEAPNLEDVFAEVVR
ncbi:MAG: ABC transporter ATP-binding protein [Coriobacteriia bacterium]|jgi:ABC-2 type transport system ATP-binding protein|nr:ABC transporter ATP-binding protein [Coriobacteriia bacterium]